MLVISAFLVLNSFSGNAQITETSLRGMVSDASGNVIVASAVVAQNEATAQVSTTTTNENGEFVFDEATLNKSGGYVVTFRSPGTDVNTSAPGTPDVPPLAPVTTDLFNVKNGTVSACPTGAVYTGTEAGPFPPPPTQ